MDHLHSIDPAPVPKPTVTSTPLQDAVAIPDASGSEAVEIEAARGDAAGTAARERRHLHLVPPTTTSR